MPLIPITYFAEFIWVGLRERIGSYKILSRAND